MPYPLSLQVVLICMYPIPADLDACIRLLFLIPIYATHVFNRIYQDYLCIRINLHKADKRMAFKDVCDM